MMPMPHKSQWLADHERALEDYADDGDREGATAELRGLGFTKEEAADQLDDIDREQGTETTVETLREEKSRVDAQMHLADARQQYRDMKGGYSQ